MPRQWGSCSPSGEIIIDPHLVKTPRDCVDYVLIHERAHLKHHDHGPAFWKPIDVHVCDWRKSKYHLDGLVELFLSELPALFKSGRSFGRRNQLNMIYV